MEQQEDIKKEKYFGTKSRKPHNERHSYFFVVLASFCLMSASCLLAFFIFVRGQEQVLVPNVVGRTLEEALLEMQERELYPKLVLRYSENSEDKGIVLEQNPEAGAIVKAGRRITITVSKGSVMAQVDDMVGTLLSSAKKELESKKKLIKLAPVLYQKSSLPEGTILAQNPSANENITSPILLKLVVSRGEEEEMVTMPDMVGLDINNVLNIMAKTPLLFDFTPHITLNNEIDNTVTDTQSPKGASLLPFSRQSVQIAMPGKKNDSSFVSGIFQKELQEYPYPVKMSLIAKLEDGSESVLVEFLHMGGMVSVPYIVPENTQLELKVADETISRLVAN